MALALASLREDLRARAVALQGLDNVLRRHLALEDAFDPAGLAERDRAFARLLLATCLRRLGQADDILARCIERPLPANALIVRNILRLGVVQLAFLGTPAHAAVDTAVALVEAARFPGLRGLVNAVLRKVARESAAWIAQQDAPRLNTPDWLWESWSGAYGEEAARKIAAAHLAEPPLDISVKADAPLWAERLEAEVLPTGSLRRSPGGAIEALPGYDEGAWWVQDAAAALPARLLGDVRGKTVIDLCAAPGGKTAQLAAAGGRVIALDRSAPRLARLEENLGRLGLEAEIVVADAATWAPPQPAEAILLDAPCSATGTIRRHPDAGHIKRPEDIAKLTAAQDRLLRAALAMLAPGGRLVYAVCSLQQEEGPARIAALLADGVPARRVPIEPAEVGGLAEMITPEGELRTLPFHLAEKGGMDAFFAARLEKL